MPEQVLASPLYCYRVAVLQREIGSREEAAREILVRAGSMADAVTRVIADQAELELVTSVQWIERVQEAAAE